MIRHGIQDLASLLGGQPRPAGKKPARVREGLSKGSGRGGHCGVWNLCNSRVIGVSKCGPGPRTPL
jgi:hypothetical protein